MAVKRKFTCKMSTLLYDGDLILTAAEGQPAFVAKRLVAGLLTTARGLWSALGGKGSSAQAQISATGTLTKEQNAAIHDMLDWFGKLKDSAKRAFGGDEVKLREEFQVGDQFAERSRQRAGPREEGVRRGRQCGERGGAKGKRRLDCRGRGEAGGGNDGGG